MHRMQGSGFQYPEVLVDEVSVDLEGAISETDESTGPGPAPQRVAEVEFRAERLREEIRRAQVARRPVRAARPRMLLWSAALALLFGALRPGVVLGGGPEAVLVAGQATVGGHRLNEVGQTASAGPGDVLATGPGARLTLAIGRGRLQLGEETLVLLERLGPVSVRLLAAGSVVVDGPLDLVTADGILVTPAGAQVEVRGLEVDAIRTHGGGRPGATLEFRAFRASSDGTEVTLVHAAGIDRVP